MNFPRLTFPLTVDFADSGYWIGDAGPYPYGAAVTAFFCGDDLADDIGDGLLIMRELERYLQTFGAHLQPYLPQHEEVSVDVFFQPEQGAVTCSVCFAFHPIEGDAGTIVERYSFSTLRDFLYVELGKAIRRGNAPRQCRLCQCWFLHEQGDRAIYCERVAPRETEKSCREVGARAVFENKIQKEEAWKIYKRAYKKYYARMMKGNMSQERFVVWAKNAAAERDAAIKRTKATADATAWALIAEKLREELNKT